MDVRHSMSGVSRYTLPTMLRPVAALALAILVVGGTGDSPTPPGGQGWTRIDLPAVGARPHPGVARPCWGVSQGVLLLAGGSNFPDAPAADGGVKVAHDDIFALGAARRWTPLADTLPHGARAEAVPASIGDLVACVGGTDGRNDLASAFTMRWDPARARVAFDTLPDLPVPLRMGVGVADGKHLYVGTGRQGGTVSNRFFHLRLDRLAEGWSELTPLPGVPREQAVAALAPDAAGHPTLCVFGGNGIDADGQQAALTDGYTYDLTQGDGGRWRGAAEVRPAGFARPVSLLGASAVVVDGQMVVAGGFDKEVWDEANRKLASLTGQELAAWRTEYLRRPLAAYRWNRRLLAYDPRVDSWADRGELPFEARCGAAMAVLPGRAVIIASGEIKPGVRTPTCYVRLEA